MKEMNFFKEKKNRQKDSKQAKEEEKYAHKPNRIVELNIFVPSLIQFVVRQ